MVQTSHSDVVKAVVAYFSESKFADFFVDVEREIQMGSTARRADIVLRDARGRFMAIAECKRPNGDVSGRLQLKSYLNATSTRFGLLATSTDINRWAFCENKGGNQFRQISRTAFEAGVLGESARASTSGSMEVGKSQSVRIWRYVAGILAIGLLISIIFLLLRLNTPEQPAAESSMQEQLVTPSETSKQPTAQTSTPEQLAPHSSTREQPVTHLKIPKQLAIQTVTPEQPLVHTIGEAVLIPAGDFLMGGSDSDAESDEQPVHTVYVDAFYIEKYEVTNA